MIATDGVLEYKCPCCDAALKFSSIEQKLSCEYCGNEFEIDSVQVYNEALHEGDQTDFQWENTSDTQWSEEEQASLQTFTCPSCGGQLIADEHTAATFCPYCDNPTVLPGRLSGTIKPDYVIPFKTTKEEATQAFLDLCKGKPLLPKMFTQEQRIEKITGMYIPFWLYDCSANFSGTYKATRVSTWADANYYYTKTDHYLLRRGASAEFVRIPMDASSKIDNTIMESIEPFHYHDIVDFDTAYLSGYLADKYDVESTGGENRIRERVSSTIDGMVAGSLGGYISVIPSARQMHVNHGKASYVLLPVWMLHTKYKDKVYTFAMNGQTGKMTGSFPICAKRSAAWFAGICAAVTAAAALVQFLFFG